MNRGHPFDLIFMDGSMPVLDGFAATREIRQNGDRAIASTPIIALTGIVRGAAADAWRAAGMNGCIVKPFAMADISAALATFVGTRANDAAAVHPEAAPPAAVDGQSRTADITLIDPAVINQIRRLGPSGGQLLNRVVGLFVERSPALLQQVRDAAVATDANGIADAAHALKSLCLSIGAKRAGGLCDAIELAAGEGKDIADVSLSELVDVVTETIEQLQALAADQAAAPETLAS